MSPGDGTSPAPEPSGFAVTPEQLKEMLDRGDAIDLIDIREPYEWDIVRIPGARLVPMGQWLSGEALAGLRRDLRPVFYCRTGVRTLDVLAVARRAGYADAVHLEGGVVAWANRIDPSLPVY
ncbi:rhodanese-like domain-containing protein [Streptomyces sp. SA15]|uniref:rhodanese-like domain-containing protein n=1 Tax=Streptomyces sp. SA15 TaxID=934019 RepID=UPI001C52FA30|nr:rhodanese-like domain-containing protein [Streptomyces sp. SA15]